MSGNGRAATEGRHGRQKVVVIGLDGASIDLVERWAPQGLLPNLASLMNRGAWGALESVLPYQSVAAWTTFLTGRSPAKHGHFDFVKREPGTRVIARVNNSESIDGATLWTLLGDAGCRVAALNVPVTYPVRPLNGFMIPDWLTPSYATGATHPPDLAAELQSRFGDYLFEFRAGPYEQGRSDEAEFLRGLHEATEKRAESALYLFETKEWDLFAIVFTGVDTIQHFLWHHTDPSHPKHKIGGGVANDEILRCYRKMDDIVGRFMRAAPSECTLIVLSDHGFGPLLRRFNANKLLMDLGLLATIPGRSDGSRLSEFLERFDLFELRKRLPERLKRRAQKLVVRTPLDWPRTKAYSGSVTENGIYINLQGRGPHGVVDPKEYEDLRRRIAERLEQCIDPATGTHVVERVVRKEDVYEGPYLGAMPDLLLVMAPGYELVESFDPHNLLIDAAAWKRTGTHRREGIFLAAGPGIVRGKRLEGASLLDVCPTILSLFGLALPDDLDGQPLEMFDEDHRARSPIPRSAAAITVPPAASTLDDSQQAKVLDRLRGLGYLE